MNEYVDSKEYICNDAVYETTNGPYIGLKLYNTVRYTGMLETKDTELLLTVKLEPRTKLLNDTWNQALSVMMYKWMGSVQDTPGTTIKEHTLTFSEFASRLTSLSNTPCEWNEKVHGMLSKHDGVGRLLPTSVGTTTHICGIQPILFLELRFLVV